MRRAAAGLALAAILLLGVGCPNAEQRLALRECQFSLRDVSIRSFGGLELELLLTVGIFNPNDIDVIVDVVTYTVSVNGRRLGSGETDRDLTIRRGTREDLPVTLRLNLIDLGVAGASLRSSDQRLFRVDATYWVALPWGRKAFPVSFSRRL